MPKTITYKCSFNSGEWSPRCFGRFDIEQYANAVGLLENFLVYQLGGAMFRPGTIYSGETKNSTTAKSNLIPFQYSTQQAYDIEVGATYMRFFANQAQVVTAPSTPLDITTPYAQADIFNLHYAQNADVMYLFNQKYPVQKLIRTSATVFSIGPANFIRGPFLDTNVGNVAITPSSATGTTTLTATVPPWATGSSFIVNDFVTEGGVHYRCVLSHTAGTFATDLASGYWVVEDFFKDTGSYGAGLGHIGSLWMVGTDSTAGDNGVVKITTYTSKTVVIGEVQTETNGDAGTLNTTSATTYWAEGAFSDYRGYPATGSFHQQRLVMANTPNQPQNIWASSIGAYEDFDIGTTADSDAYTFQLASDQPNPIRWVKSNYNALQLGTSSGTANASGSSSSVITPTDIQIKFDTDWGTAPLLPKRVSSFIMYLQSNNFQMRELSYDFYSDRNIANDMNKFADHILRDGNGVADLDRQQSPNERFWVLRNDGQIAVLTRNPEEKVMGWSRIIAGKTAKGHGIFEAISITQKDGYDDQICVIVKRNINGTARRYVEYFSPEMFVNQWEPVRLDCSLTYDNPKTISGMSNDIQGILTVASHGFSNGDQVKVDLIKVVDSDRMIIDCALNTNFYIVSDQGPNSFKLKDENGNYIDTTDFGTYSSGGEVRKMITAITSGLDHLEGEVVTVVTDGALPSKQQTYLVSSGAITLAEKAAVITIGLPYQGNIRLLPLSEGGQGKMRRIYLSSMRVVQSLGLQIGQDEDNLTTIYFRPPNIPLGHAPALVTDDVEQYFDAWWSKRAEIYIRQKDPLPLMILSIILRLEVEEKE